LVRLPRVSAAALRAGKPGLQVVEKNLRLPRGLRFKGAMSFASKEIPEWN
jgi:hypothetical protein